MLTAICGLSSNSQLLIQKIIEIDKDIPSAIGAALWALLDSIDR